ncbi:MAG: hypothetical protein ACI4UU_05325 [Clostridia bacterium]
MSSTNVHSKQNTVGSAMVAGSAFNVTEKDLEFPPKGQVFEVVSGYIEEQGNIEIAAGNGFVTENGELVKQDGSAAKMDPEAYRNIVKARKEREKYSPSKNRKTEEAER